MRLRTTSLAMALLSAPIGSVSGQQGASAAKPAELSDLVGLYEGPRGFIAIVPLGGGGSTRLLLADAAGDQLRMLFPVAADSFVAGPEVAKPEPIQLAVRVRRSPAGARQREQRPAQLRARAVRPRRPRLRRSRLRQARHGCVVRFVARVRPRAARR